MSSFPIPAGGPDERARASAMAMLSQPTFEQRVAAQVRADASWLEKQAERTDAFIVSAAFARRLAAYVRAHADTIDAEDRLP